MSYHRNQLVTEPVMNLFLLKSNEHLRYYLVDLVGYLDQFVVGQRIASLLNQNKFF